MSKDAGMYDYRPATNDQSRSPCPALNALANHGIIPRSGRRIGILTLTRAIVHAYNLSYSLAFILSFVGILWCGSWGKIDLHQLAQHNKIEHDGSLAHANAEPGAKYAPSRVSEKLLQGILYQAFSNPGHDVSVDDFAKLRAEREASLAAPLSAVHSKLAYGEAAMTMLAMQDANGRVSAERLRQWYGDERLPDGWTRPAEPITVKRVDKLATQIKESARQVTMQQT